MLQLIHSFLMLPLMLQIFQLLSELCSLTGCNLNRQLCLRGLPFLHRLLRLHHIQLLRELLVASFARSLAGRQQVRCMLHESA